MTVIIPSCLTSAFAADTKASELGLDAVSKAFEQSLTARGKHSPSQTWLRRWKTDSWMQLLFSRTFQLSHGSSSLRSWLEASCPLDGHASLSQQQENEKQRRTSGGSSTSLQMELPLFDQECFSQRTSKDSCPQKCQTVLVSLGTVSRDWSGYITGLRQAYSQRLNAERHTNGSGCSSWPSPVASEVRQGFQDRSRGMKGSQESLTTVVIKQSGPPVPASSSTDGSRPGLSQEGRLWMTPKSGACGMTATTSGRPLERATQLTTQVHVVEKQWQTATVSTGAHKQKDGSMINKLDQQVKSWATPDVSDRRSDNCRQIGLSNQTQGKLNPRWVETLMGLPVGWTMPSCVSPVTIERTSFDCLGMESYQQQPKGPSES